MQLYNFADSSTMSSFYIVLNEDEQTNNLFE